MNYIGLIRCFWRSHEQHSFNTTEISLYFHLLEICNVCNWENPFKRNNAKIRADLSISYNTLQNARNKLQQKGLISFKTINGSPNTFYTLSNFDKVDSEVGGEVYSKVSAKVGMTKDKLNKTKQNKENNKEKPTRFLPPQLTDIIDYFISMKELIPNDAEDKANRFYHFYNSKNWMVGKNKMSNWKSAATKSLSWGDNKQTKKHAIANHGNDKIYEQF